MVTILDLIPNISTQELIFQIFLPFILIFAILWGIISALRLFDSRVNLIISFVITILLASTEAFVTLTIFYTQLGASFVFLLFIGLFVVGGTMWAFNRGRDIHHETSSPTRALDRINKHIGKIERKYDEAYRSHKPELANSYHTALMKLEAERDRIIRALRSEASR